MFHWHNVRIIGKKEVEVSVEVVAEVEEAQVVTETVATVGVVSVEIKVAAGAEVMIDEVDKAQVNSNSTP